MTVNDEPRASDVRELLVRYLYDNGTSSASDMRVNGPIYSGYNSRIFKVTCPRLPYPCALKFCLKPRTLEPNPDSARRQFLTLQRVSDAMSANTRFRVASPQFLMEFEGALVIEWINGKCVSDILFGRGQRPRHAQTMVERSATWLHNFHAGNSQPPGTLDTDGKVSVIEDICAQGAIRGELADSCQRLLIDSARATQLVTLPRSWVHGDFKSDNLIISGETVFGIDIHTRREDVVIADIAQFLNHLELHLSGWQYPQLRFYKRRLIRHFVTNYGRAGIVSWPRWELPLAWMRLYMLLHAWSIISTKKQRLLPSFIHQRQYQAAIANTARDLRAFF